jgi:hypothetical protein
MRTFPIPRIPFREASVSEPERSPRPYHVSERPVPARQFACSHNCGHRACVQGCKLEERKRAFLEGN